jgi:hypothetical protein
VEVYTTILTLFFKYLHLELEIAGKLSGRERLKFVQITQLDRRAIEKDKKR